MRLGKAVASKIPAWYRGGWGALAIGGVGALKRAFSQAALPAPGASGIDHIVVLMMENRSFDHMLGWVDGADGRQRGLTYLDETGTRHDTYQLAPDYQGCGHPDPDHSFEGGRTEYNGGACDGWLRAGDNDDHAIGYYTKKDLEFFGNVAKRWTMCDRYFSATIVQSSRADRRDVFRCASHGGLSFFHRTGALRAVTDQ